MASESKGSNAVANSTQNHEWCSPLCSLPELPLETVLQCLEKEDIRRLVCVCRSLAAAVSALSPATQVKVTPFTNWTGLCKVLATRAITCKSMCIQRTATHKRQHVGWWSWVIQQSTALGRSAVDVLLEPGTWNVSFPGIPMLDINAHSLPCILPPKLASLLPDLQELDVTCGPDLYANDGCLQPIPYCRSLRTIRFRATTPQLPSKYHTSEDLRRQLPNVVNLEIRLLTSSSSGNINTVWGFVQTLVNAWGGQLTKLVLYTGKTPVQLKHCIHLQSLDWSIDHRTLFGTCLPLSITQLQVGSITESHLKTILQLPQLSVLTLFGFVGSLQHDWSQHPCRWQQLKISFVRMVYLTKLPLHSLEGPGCLNIEYLELPSPLRPDALSEVQHAAQCVSNADIMIGGFRDWKLLPNLSDQGVTVMAQVMRAACRVICPSQSHQFSYGMARYSQMTTEMIMWLSPTIEFLQMPYIPKTLPWLWDVLSHCNNLVKLKFLSNETGEFLADVAALLMHAAEHYVSATGRTIKLAIGGSARVCDAVQEETLIRVIQLQQGELSNFALLGTYTWSTNGCLEVTLLPRGLEHASASSTLVTWQQSQKHTATTPRPQQEPDRKLPRTLPRLVIKGDSIHPVSIIKAWSAICSLLRFLHCTNNAVRDMWLRRQQWEEEGEEKLNYFAASYTELADAADYADWEHVKQVLHEKFQLPIS